MANFLSTAVATWNIRALRSWHTVLSPKFVDNFFLSCAALPFALAGGVIGWMAWGSGPEVWRLAWLLLLPIGWGLAASRWSSGLLMAGYYLAGARGLPGGTVAFFGDSAPGWWGWAFWAIVCGLLTVPFVVLWSANNAARGWRFLLAVGVSVVPPLGLVGWISPLAIAGVVFPGLGWVGLLLGLGTMAALVVRSPRWIAGLGAIALAANVGARAVDAKVPDGWVGMDTHFSRLSSAGSDDAGQLLAAMRRVEWVKGFAATVPANSVWVLPETILGPFGGVSEFALMDVEAGLASRDSRVLVGAEIAQADGRYLNAMVVLGAKDGEGRLAVQGIPVPVSMWKPWASGGAVADVFGHGGIVTVNGQRAGVLICYEQLLTFSVLWAMVSRPDVLVGLANVWWVQEGSIPEIQGQMLRVFGRLFGVGVVEARNF